tara:strand:- start:1438 stop:1794 length:357 start_codon:yes stop_codon:yes gene_type:complete
MRTQIKDRLGRVIGFVENNTYFTSRDSDKNQIFKNPKYLSAVGISKEVAKQLLILNVKKLNFYITHFEEKDFDAIIDLKEFLMKSKEANFKGVNSDPQFILSLGEFKRRYAGQMVLEK